ncbi:unnamed protein product [Arctia plantaginis]|uniref:Lipase n=1 Tax=Arctia plantaginis TaxID=874455 RepID=A0A8S0ZTZ8_ARCPL|nr:unnamed protein product [Arctia plantaginis]
MYISNILAITLFTILHSINSTSKTSIKVKTPKVAPDKFCKLAKQYNLNCTRYNVTTQDGYILGVYNIPGKKPTPIYLQHGFVDSSDTFLIRGYVSLVAFLAEEGYDVWLGNMRGNVHSRAHLWMNPDELPFWEFSLHEIAIQDMPSIIDFILKKTGENQLQAITHSEGSAAFFAMGAVNPEYNKKVKLLICLAPIAYLHNAESPLFQLVAFKKSLFNPGKVSGYGELMRNSSALVALIRVTCMQKMVGYSRCVNSFIIDIFGRAHRQPEPEFWPTGLKHYPCGSSLKNGIHLLQIASSKKFAQFDYGPSGNKIKYHSRDPPKYNLNKVSMKIALMIGMSDNLSVEKDVEILRGKLPNVVDYHVMSLKSWDHLDFVWGRYMNIHLFRYIKDLLIKHS